MPEQLSAATGRSYLPDATDEDAALLREPLFARPTQASIGDNPFNTAYEHMDSFWNAANALAVCAGSFVAHTRGVAGLQIGIDAFHRRTAGEVR